MNPRENIPSPRRPARDTTEQLDPKALAASRREAMRRRAFRIRRSVTGLALALFTAAFVGIYVQLASGNDPALTSAAKRHATTTSTSAASTATSGSESSSGSTSSGEASGEGGESSSSTGEESSSESTSAGTEASSESPSAVTTSQS